MTRSELAAWFMLTQSTIYGVAGQGVLNLVLQLSTLATAFGLFYVDYKGSK